MTWRRKALDTFVTLKFHFLYAITSKHNRMLCNCTVGSDSFGSVNSWKPFTRNAESNFLFRQHMRQFWCSRSQSSFFPLYRQTVHQLKTPRNSREMYSLGSPMFPNRFDVNLPRCASVFPNVSSFGISFQIRGIPFPQIPPLFGRGKLNFPIASRT